MVNNHEHIMFNAGRNLKYIDGDRQRLRDANCFSYFRYINGHFFNAMTILYDFMPTLEEVTAVISEVNKKMRQSEKAVRPSDRAKCIGLYLCNAQQPRNAVLAFCDRAYYLRQIREVSMNLMKKIAFLHIEIRLAKDAIADLEQKQV